MRFRLPDLGEPSTDGVPDRRGTVLVPHQAPGQVSVAVHQTRAHLVDLVNQQLSQSGDGPAEWFKDLGLKALRIEWAGKKESLNLVDVLTPQQV